MKIAVSSQNFRTVTAHAGKARRFIVFDLATPCTPREVERLDAAGPASAAEADAARARLRELLDEQDRELRKFRENAAEMRKVMGEGKP